MAFPNYTENVPPMPTSEWKSDNTFTYSILSEVYKVANKNIASIFPHYNDLKLCKLNEENLLDFSCWADTDADLIIDEVKSPFVYIGVWLGLAIIFTIAGIGWCLFNKCCCCSKYRKTNEMDYLVNTDSQDDIRRLGLSDGKLSDTKLVWKVTVGVVMGLLIIGFSFSVFMSFASNESMRKSIFELYDDVSLSVDDAETYVETTKRQIDGTFITSYMNLSSRIEQEIEPFIDAVSVSIRMDKQVTDIWTNADTLLVELKILENRIIGPKESDLSGLSHSLSHLQSTLEDVVVPFVAKVGEIGGRDIGDAINKTGQQLQNNAKDLTDALSEVPIKDIRQDVENAENDWLDAVGSAVYGSFMGFNLILLMTLICIVIGSVVAWVGKGSGKNTGFLFYRFSIVMMFVFGWIITLVMITQFATSGFMTRIACEAVQGLENSTSPTPKDLWSSIRGTKKVFFETPVDYIVPSYSHVVNNCKLDQSAYMAFQLFQVYDALSIFNISDNFNMSSIIPPNPTNVSSDSFFMKNVNSVYFSVYKELVALESFEDVVPEFSNLSESGGTIKSLYSRINFLLGSLLEEMKALESGDFVRSGSNTKTVENIIELVEHYEQFVYDQVTSQIGRCKPLYHALNSTLHTFCYKVLAPVATYWWSLQLLLIIFVAVICTALISERVFK